MAERMSAARARWMYEWGRCRWAAQRGLWTVPVGLSSMLVGVSGGTVAMTTLLLWGVVFGLSWWRTPAGTGALLGAQLGVIPVVIGLGMRMMPWPMTVEECTWFCSVTGAALGALSAWHLANRAPNEVPVRWSFGVSALAAATMAVVVGCGPVGGGAFIGWLVGTLLVGLPRWLIRADLSLR